MIIKMKKKKLKLEKKKSKEKSKAKDVAIIKITGSGQTTFDNVWPPMKAIGIITSVCRP